MTLTGATKQSKNAVIVGCSTSPYEGWTDVMSNIRDYKGRAELMKKAVDQQGFCSCNTTCQTYACAQAKLLTSEQGCCQVFDNCKVEHPEQDKNPQANVVNMCCQKCAVQNLQKEDYVALYQKENLAIFSSLGPSMGLLYKIVLIVKKMEELSPIWLHLATLLPLPSHMKAKLIKFAVQRILVMSILMSRKWLVHPCVCDIVGMINMLATPAAAANGALIRDYFMQGFYPSGVANSANAIQPSAALGNSIEFVLTLFSQGHSHC